MSDYKSNENNSKRRRINQEKSSLFRARHFEKKMTLLSRKLRMSKSVFLIRKSRIRIRMVEA